MCQLYFAFNCLASGQTFIDDWYITCYNLIFTALPLCVSALSDSDLDIKYGKEKKNLALLYKENRDKYKIFSFPRFIFRLIKGIIISLLIFVLCCFNEILKNGRNKNIWYLSLKTYTSVLIVVSINLMISSDYIIYILPLSIGITTFLFYGIFLVINHYGFLFNFNSKASIKQSFNSPLTYLNIFLICSFSFIIDYTTKLSNIFISGSLSLKLILKKALKSDRKSLYTTSRLFNSKSYSKVSKKRSERRNLDYDDKSKNNFIPKSPKKSYNSIKFQECNTPKAFNNNKYKVGPDYKNDFFSVKLLKIKNNSDNIAGKPNKKSNNKLDESND
jgi:magnesium-transporting ATPase (P-type)